MVEQLDKKRKTIASINAIALFVIVFCFFTSCNNDESKDTIKVEKKKSHEGIHAAFYNSDGSRISISSTMGRLALLDSNLNLIKIGEGHKGNANSCFFSVDDKYIVTGGLDKKMRVWEADSLSLFKEYNFNFNSWTSIHGYTTLGGCGEGGKVVFYNKATLDTVAYQLEKEGAFHCYYIQIDTSFVVSSGFSGYELYLQKRKKAHRYSGHKNWVYCIMPDNAGKRIVTASRDSTVKIFDRFTEKCLASSEKLDGAVYVACFNKQDNTVAASTSNGSVYFMDVKLQEIKMKIKAFDTRINTIHYSPNGRDILVGSEEGGVKIFSIVDGNMLHEFNF